VNSVAEAEQLARPARFDPLTMLATAFPRLRRYAPTLLDSFQFNGTSACQPLLDGLTLLKELNASERLKRVPSDAPIEFVSPRWEPHVVSVTGAIDRPFYELCALSTLRDRLRAGDVWVAGSRQYRAFDEYLLPQPAWRELRETQPIPVAVETTCETYLEQRRDEIHQAMTKVAGLLANDQLPDVRLRHGRLTITPLRTTVPPEAEELGRRAYELLRWVRMTDLLVEVDELTGMSRHFYPSAYRRADQGCSSAPHPRSRRQTPAPIREGLDLSHSGTADRRAHQHRPDWEPVGGVTAPGHVNSPGTVTASLVLRKLASYPRQNGLAWGPTRNRPHRPDAVHARLAAEP
jgi:hypothetical protein